MQFVGLPNRVAEDIKILRLRECCALLLASCLQAISVFLALMLLQHTNYKLPVFLALMTFAVVTCITRIAVLVLDLPDTIWNKCCSSQYLELALAGMFMGLTLAADLASLQYLELPAYILMKAAAPVLTTIAGFIITSNWPGAAHIAKQLVIILGVAAALHATPNLSMHGLKYQMLALILEAVWKGLLAHAQQNNQDFQDASPLAIMANLAPIALVTLLSLYVREERQIMHDEFHRWKWEVFLICVTVMVTAAGQIAVILVRPLGTSTAMGAGAAVGPEISCFFAAETFLLSTTNKYQILGYVCAKVGQLMCVEDEPLEGPYEPNNREYMLPVSTRDDDHCLQALQSDVVVDSGDLEPTTAEILAAGYAGLNLHTSCQLAAMAGCNAKGKSVSGTCN